MPVEKFRSDAEARNHLRRQGFRQITFPTNRDPEFWWRDETAEAAEVARRQVFTYFRWTNAYQEIAGRVRKIAAPRGRPPSDDEGAMWK